MEADQALDRAADIIDKNGKAEEFYELAKVPRPGRLVVGVVAPGTRPDDEKLDRSYCSVGALRMALWGKTDLMGEELVDHRRLAYDQAMEALADAMTEQFTTCIHGDAHTDPFHIITCINDKLATKDDVVACMQKAAQHLRDAQS